MASAVIMMLGGAVTNALAFSGSNYLFSHMGSDSNEERKTHNKAMEQLEAAQAAWSKRRTQRLDFINEQLQKERHSKQTFENVDEAMKEYYYVTGPPKPELSDFYRESEEQKNREIAFVVGGMALTGIIAWRIHKIK